MEMLKSKGLLKRLIFFTVLFKRRRQHKFVDLPQYLTVRTSDVVIV